MLSSGGNITALSVERDLVTVVMAESRGGKWHLTGGYELAQGLDPRDSAALKDAVAKAADGAGILGSSAGASAEVAVSIDDRYARSGLFTFAEFPASPEDAMSIVRLRAKKEFALKDTAVRLDYHVLENAAVTKVLVVAVDEGIASAIEEALGEKGIDVGRLGLHSFHLANLLADTAPSDGNFSVVTIIDGTLTLMIFSNGILDFYRSKSFKGGADELTGDLRISFVSYGGRSRDAGIERILLFGGEMDMDAVSKGAGVDIKRISVGDFLESAGAASATDSTDILRLAAIGACL